MALPSTAIDNNVGSNRSISISIRLCLVIAVVALLAGISIQLDLQPSRTVIQNNVVFKSNSNTTTSSSSKRSSLVNGNSYSTDDNTSNNNTDNTHTNSDSNSDSNSNSNSNDCHKILLYASDIIAADAGVGHRLSQYLLASIVATLTNAALVILDPPRTLWNGFGGSPFGCPLTNNGNGNTTADTSCGNIPTGLSRILQPPFRLTRGCIVPCAHTHSYHDWYNIAKRTTYNNHFQFTTCTNHDTSNYHHENVTVLAIGGFQLKYYWTEKLRRKFILRPAAVVNDNSNSDSDSDSDSDTNNIEKRSKWEQWVTTWSIRMGASYDEIQHFINNNNYDGNHNDDSNNSNHRANAMEYLAALMNRAEVLTFQPWIVNDVKAYLKQATSSSSSVLGLLTPSPSLMKPMNIIAGYDSMHIRRGDRIGTKPSMIAVEQYWNDRGYYPMTNTSSSSFEEYHYPTNYVPFDQYWRQYQAMDNCSNINSSNMNNYNHYDESNDQNHSINNSNNNNSKNNMPIRYIYIATDDVDTVKAEIANLTSVSPSSSSLSASTSPNNNNNNNTVYHCGQRVEFIFNPQVEYATHLHVSNQIINSHANGNGSGDGNGVSTTFIGRDNTNQNDNNPSHDQYLRTISAMTDLYILSQSDTFVGESPSFWGRLLNMCRTLFEDFDGGDDDSDGGDDDGSLLVEASTATRKIIIAWGAGSGNSGIPPPW